jgi:uncharacterized protein YqeY
MTELSLLAKIKADLLAARKARQANVVSVLNPLVAEASAPGFNDGKRESTDAEVVKVINGFVSGISLCIETSGGKANESQAFELSLLKQYLPELMPQDELSGIIDDIISKNGYSKISDMKAIMSELSVYAGRFDGKAAGDLVKKKLLGNK